MMISAPTMTAPAPGTVAEISVSSGKASVDSAQSTLARQPGEVVSLSLQGQTMSYSDRAGSMGETSETRSQETGESASIQFQEGETGGGNSPPPVTGNAAAGIAAYTNVAGAK